MGVGSGIFWCGTLVVVDVMSTTGLAAVTVTDSSSPPTAIRASARATNPTAAEAWSMMDVFDPGSRR